MADLDVVETVQRRVQRRVGERARVDVGRDGDVAVPRGKQRVDARARPDVDRAADARARCQDVEEPRGRRVGRDVVRRVVDVAGEPVGREQHVADRRDP